MEAKKGPTVTITDVTLREYGQNVPLDCLHIFTPEIRVRIARALVDAGFTQIEIFSCIHPDVAPAMNPEALTKISRGIGRVNGVRFITLVPNRRGYQTFRSLGLGPEDLDHTLGIFFSAVEAHNLANLGRPVQDTLEEYASILRQAADEHVRTAAYISAAFGYRNPETGSLIPVDTRQINEYVDLLFDLGAQTVTLSDLQGVASSEETRRVLERVLDGRREQDRVNLGYHPHHVSGDRAIANSKIAYDMGIRRFDSSLGGTGGCVTGAPGNQPTEKLVQRIRQWGGHTGLDEGKISSLSAWIQKNLYGRILLPT
jgi:hydroxymethylglutaryl-CoA lyase